MRPGSEVHLLLGMKCLWSTYFSVCVQTCQVIPIRLSWTLYIFVFSKFKTDPVFNWKTIFFLPFLFTFIMFLFCWYWTHLEAIHLQGNISLSKYWVCPSLCSLRWIFRAQSKSLLVVMHSSNSPCPCDQDVWLPVPPDLPDNSFPLLQTSCLLQLLSWCEHIHAPQGTIRLTATITHGWPHGHFRDLCLLFIIVCDALILLFLTWILQVSPLWGKRRSLVATSPAGDADHHEAQCHEQAQTDTHHEVEGEALWVGCDRKKKQSEKHEIY